MSSNDLFDGYNVGYVQDLYERFSRNPDSVPGEWQEIFKRGIGAALQEGLLVPEGLAANGTTGAASAVSAMAPTPPVRQAGVASESPTPGDAGLQAFLPVVARATSLIQALRDHGHQAARLDPLGTEPPGHPQLDPSFFGTSMRELERVPTSVVLGNGRTDPIPATIQRLREIYCDTIGYQFEHLEDPEKVVWLWNEVESGVHTQEMSREDKLWLLERLTQVEGMERFLHRAYLGQKRFSVEGTDMLVPMLDVALEEAGRLGTREVILGMAHRGRLNVLTHIVGISFRSILREFEGAPQAPGPNNLMSAGTGDVKYHHGASGDYDLRSGSDIRVTLSPNPSHLEFVNPVVSGMARAQQFPPPHAPGSQQDLDRVVPVLIHGDAAFAAEGVVAESLNLARLRGYATGGTIHIIANNQVGFTTNPIDARSTRYSSDLAKGYDIPVIHVNADDAAACLAAVRLAMAYRARFHDDILIDLMGYRRHGHNEGDEPAYTQPALYAQIAEHPTVRTLWAQRLTDEGVLSVDEAEAMDDRVQAAFREDQEAVQETAGPPGATLAAPQPEEARPVEADTAVTMERLAELNAAALRVPDSFTIHPKLARQLERRTRDFSEDTELEWAHGEVLAFGALLEDGIPLRLSGQDSQRGTFSQRHLVLHDVENGATTVPLEHVGNARFEVYNSPLSEVAVLGFDYGYSVALPQGLTLWEAQFGDFVNVAQPILDQFIASGRAKWSQDSRLTLLLPHGHEGQGPEHSSARLERFLQLCAEDNLRVAYPTTPAQYFHLLRRQALASPARPLVVMTPKSLLRHPMASSPVSELTRGSFRRLLPDPRIRERESEVRRLVLCSGKLYYDLLATAQKEDGAQGVALGRVEELYPFPAEELEVHVGRLSALEEVIWAQEEPRNMGALSYIGPRLRAVVPRNIPLRYVARPERSSPAEGRAKAHAAEQDRLVREALGLPREEA
ncbi:MAG: 2-oxoglutarate dehydrogenase E1 component [Gemmatimonadota bacterium]